MVSAQKHRQYYENTYCVCYFTFIVAMKQYMQTVFYLENRCWLEDSPQLCEMPYPSLFKVLPFVLSVQKNDFCALLYLFLICGSCAVMLLLYSVFGDYTFSILWAAFYLGYVVVQKMNVRHSHKIELISYIKYSWFEPHKNQFWPRAQGKE